MTDEAQTRRAVEAVWAELAKPRAVMLGILSSPHGAFQPMTPHADRDTNTLWFFTRYSVDLAKAATDSALGQVIVLAHDQGVYATLSGELMATHDAGIIARYWNPVIAAWYPLGQSDPDLCMMRFTPHAAEIWNSDTNPVKFAFEIAKANLTGSTPDLGKKAEVALS